MPDSSPPPSAKPEPRWLLRRADQLAVATLTLTSLLAMAGYWFAQGGASGRLIEIDRAPQRTAEFLVDVNRADWPELAELPGVGETIAHRIVETRTERGPFVDHQDLRRVRGIGPATLERMRPFLLPMSESRSVAGP